MDEAEDKADDVNGDDTISPPLPSRSLPLLLCVVHLYQRFETMPSLRARNGARIIMQELYLNLV